MKRLYNWRVAAAFAVSAIVVFSGSGIAEAHGEGVGQAPDLHPLAVMLEFVVVWLAGHAVACGLTRIGARRRSRP